MIYFASYFEPQNHHGTLFSISRSQPNGFSLEKIAVFAPDYSLHKLPEAEYVDAYREQLKAVWSDVLLAVRFLSEDYTAEDCTLLCWEKAGRFCHRNLVAKVFERYAPSSYGGCDVAVAGRKIA